MDNEENPDNLPCDHLWLEANLVVHEIQVDFNDRQESFLGDHVRAHLE